MFIRLIVAMHCDNVTVTRIWPILIRSNRGYPIRVRLGTRGSKALCERRLLVEPFSRRHPQRGYPDTIFEEERCQEQSARTAGFTRRSFLKATGAVAGAAAVTGVATPTLQALAADYESGQKESEQERIFRGVCRPNCFAFCHLNVHVRDGKVVKTSRAPYNEKCYDRICQRGLSSCA